MERRYCTLAGVDFLTPGGERRIADFPASSAGVLAYDARGHGRFTGRSTPGGLEVLDVDVAAGPQPLARRMRELVAC